MSSKDSIFDILLMSNLFTKPTPRYYTCKINMATRGMECTPTENQEGTVMVPSSVPKGGDADWISKATNVAVKITPR